MLNKIACGTRGVNCQKYCFYFQHECYLQGELLEPHVSMTSTMYDIREIVCQTKTTLDDFMMAEQMYKQTNW